jgi:hypothetical protein
VGPRAGAENLAPTGIRSPDRPARSQSLYRLSYPAHQIRKQMSTITFYDCTVPTSMYHIQYALTCPHTSEPAAPLPEEDEGFKSCVFKHRVSGDVKTLDGSNCQQAYLTFSLAQ